MILPRIAARIFDVPLLIDGRKAEAMLLGIGARIVGDEVEITNPAGTVDHVAFAAGRPSMGRIGNRLERAFERAKADPFDVVDGVAVIPIEGTLVHKGAYVGQFSGETSYQGLQAQVRRALKSESVKGAVFEVDSFGGEAAGAFETADMISELSSAKPTLAILTDFALSAGYLLAAAAREIVMPEFGRAGSIGVVRMHVDWSRHLEQEGIKVTLITAGKHKADGNKFQPLQRDLAERLYAENERMRVTFAAAVGRYRGVRFTAAQAMATEADDFGAEDSIRLGLADGVGKGNELFDAFVRQVNQENHR